MMRPLILAAVAVILFAGTAGAADNGNYTAMGWGNGSCGSWTAARRTPQGMQARGNGEWVLGFLSGAGAMGLSQGYDPLHGTDPEGVLAWVDNYCRDHPLESIAEAASAFIHAHPH
jgi:hypothetical protein